MKVRFINFERTKLPEEILRHNLEEKRKYFSDICLEVEKSDAEVQVNFVDSSLSLSMYIYRHIHTCMHVFCGCHWIIISYCMSQAEGVYNQRLQNLAVTLDKVFFFSVLYKVVILYLYFL